MEYHEDAAAVQALPPSCLFSQLSGEYGQEAMKKYLDGMEKHHYPLSDWLHDALRPHAGRLVPDEARYTLVFDKLEILLALSYTYHDQRERTWAPPGAFCYRKKSWDRVIQEIEGSISTTGDESPYVTSGIFGETTETCKQGLAALRAFVAKLNWRY